eukprot:1814989-Rhodomonas_salina.1
MSDVSGGLQDQQISDMFGVVQDQQIADVVGVFGSVPARQVAGGSGIVQVAVDKRRTGPSLVAARCVCLNRCAVWGMAQELSGVPVSIESAANRDGVWMGCWEGECART